MSDQSISDKTYLVGGAIRNKMLDLPVRERDWVVVGSTVSQMKSLGYRQVGRDFPVFLHPDTNEEYALARTERKTSPGYHGFSVHASPDVTLEEDLGRRDLTINAIAQDSSGNLIDPYGGRRDIEQRMLRHISPAFAEDPVRVLRVARFAAQFASLGFHIATETLSIMRDMTTAGEIDALVPERLWQELVRALETPSPEIFFQTLRQCGALNRLIPELDRLWGVPQPPQWHPEVDTGIHTMLVLKCAAQLSSEPSVRFAALMHDLGKGTTPPEEWPRHPGHEKRSEDLIEGICDRLKTPNSFRKLASLTAREHGNVHKVFEMRASSLLNLLERADALRRPERFGGLLLACKADACGRPGFEAHPYPQAEYLIKVLESIRNVPVQPLIKQGFKGGDLADRLRQERIRVIDKLDKPPK